jgi:NAD(P)-dependent dehydrogenase (short-subunit alcohol dehydrogenase family)
MPASRHGALIIFGSGPGIGVHVASRFARGGFQKVILLSRNATRLSDDAFMVWSIAPEVEVSTVCVDLTSAVDLQDAFGRIKDVLGETPVECVYYNAARVEPTSLLHESAEDLRLNLEVGLTMILGTRYHVLTLLPGLRRQPLHSSPVGDPPTPPSRRYRARKACPLRDQRLASHGTGAQLFRPWSLQIGPAERHNHPAQPNAAQGSSLRSRHGKRPRAPRPRRNQPIEHRRGELEAVQLTGQRRHEC